MGCIEICPGNTTFHAIPINRNMGCIEIAKAGKYNAHLQPINRNMGCIEMLFPSHFRIRPVQINRNMGCIEIGSMDNCKIGMGDKP